MSIFTRRKKKGYQSSMQIPTQEEIGAIDEQIKEKATKLDTTVPKVPYAKIGESFTKTEKPEETPYEFTKVDVGEEPNRSDYSWYTDFAETPLTEEERKKRERAAYLSAGFGHLGSALGSLGNMFFAAGGAPAQKLTEVADVSKEVSKFRERADKVRNAYLHAHTLDRSAYEKDRADWLNKVKINNAAVVAQNKQRLEMAKQQATMEMEKLKADYWRAR